jgi:hypothetical protein
MKSKWKPIDSAPLDGTKVLLFRPPDAQFVGCYISLRIKGGTITGWRIFAHGSPAIWPKPTHWMPLPEAPINQK